VRHVDDYLPSGAVARRELKIASKSTMLPEQAVAIAGVMAKFVSGGYPEDLPKLVGYRSPDLSDDNSSATRGSLTALLGRNELAYIWGLLPKEHKDRIVNYRRHKPEDYVLSLEVVWNLLLTLKGF